MPTSSDKQSLQRLLKMITYLGKFLPNLFVSVTEPLRRLLDRDVAWHWEDAQENAVNQENPFSGTLTNQRSNLAV